MLAVLVNGLPGSGKTTLALALSSVLGLPLYRKDAINETLAHVLGVTPPDALDTRAWSRALAAAASETMWTLLAESPTGAVLEAPRSVTAEPLGLGPVYRIDTSTPVGPTALAALATAIRA